MVRHCLYLAVEDEAIIQDGLVNTVGRELGVFYADEDILVSRDLEWLMGALNVLIGLF